jgi:uncharacterized protein YuzE
METLAQAFPDLCSSLADALAGAGRADLATQLQAAQIAEVTFDNSADAGYIYVHPVGTTHGETIALESMLSVVVDTNSAGQLQGVELLSPSSSLKAELRRRAAVKQIAGADA